PGTAWERSDRPGGRGACGARPGGLGYRAPPYATARSVSEALDRADRVGYPLLVRPSYVLGGRAMEIVYSSDGLADYLRREVGDTRGGVSTASAGQESASGPGARPAPGAGERDDGRPPAGGDGRLEAAAHTIFLDRFLENATEVDVDALCDGRQVWIGGIMQHVEEAGVHSGDSACVLPPHSLGEEMLEQVREATREIALVVGVVGL